MRRMTGTPIKHKQRRETNKPMDISKITRMNRKAVIKMMGGIECSLHSLLGFGHSLVHGRIATSVTTADTSSDGVTS